jgi:hypothetical protein
MPRRIARRNFIDRAKADAFMLAADRLDPQPSPYQNDPAGWVTAKTHEYLWSKQKEILQSLRDNRYTAVMSCHDSGKSFIASRAMAWWGDVHPPMEAFVVSTAPTWPQVKTILWRELMRAHTKGRLDGRITLDCHWRLGKRYDSEIIGYGRKPADYDASGFQGIHQKYVLAVIDEAGGVPKVLFDAVDTIVTNKHCRVLAIGNPDDPSSYFREICMNEKLGWNVIQIDGLQTPNFTEEYVPAHLRDLLLSPEWVEERRVRWGEASPLFTSKVRGRFPDTSDDALIPPAWLYPAINRKLSGTGREPGVYGLDIARSGTDRSVCYRNRGGYVNEVFKTGHPDTMHVARLMQADMAGKRGVRAVADEVGVGAGAVDKLREDGVDVYGYNGGRMAVDTEHFVNARSEDFWYLRTRFQDGTISIPDDDDLKNQLLQLKWSILPRTEKIVVESKEDYKKRTNSTSPDEADALMMCFVGDGANAAEPLENLVSELDDHGRSDEEVANAFGHSFSEPGTIADVLEVVW